MDGPLSKYYKQFAEYQKLLIPGEYHEMLLPQNVWFIIYNLLIGIKSESCLNAIDQVLPRNVIKMT